ncbi:MAG TPA: hypothetical protein VFE64_00195 [Devosia sp.]|jgi:hypothetical protein|nr:hypothetical protein [Devosia sp.]
MTAIVARFLVAAGAAVLLSGCAYDYLQHTDRVGYSAGDAVKANLAQETTNPSKRSMYLKGGLGKNGIVTPQGDAAPAPTN